MVACKSHFPSPSLLFESNRPFLTCLRQFLSRTHWSQFLSLVSLQAGLGSYSFIIFSVICLVTLVYIWLVVPETKSKTFLEISQMFAKRNKVEIKLGDGDLPLKETKESLEGVLTVTSFWTQMGAFRGQEVSALGDIEMTWKGFNLASFFILQGILTQSLFVLFLCGYYWSLLNLLLLKYTVKRDVCSLWCASVMKQNNKSLVNLYSWCKYMNTIHVGSIKMQFALNIDSQVPWKTFYSSLHMPNTFQTPLIISDILKLALTEAAEPVQEHLYWLSSCTPPYRPSLVVPQLNTFPTVVLFLSHDIWSRMSAVVRG